MMKGARGSQAIIKAVNELYTAGQTDYAFEPILVEDQNGTPTGLIEDGDVVIFCCRRGEREIQLTEAFTDPELNEFPRKTFSNLTFIILTLYHDKFKSLPVAFSPDKVKETLGEVVSRANLRQLRVSESEKFAHVTFFLNGGNNQPFKGEEDVRIPSPKGIPPDSSPELSLAEVSAEVIKGIHEGYDLIVTNFANGDVIGHTGDREAKIRCAAFVDKHLGEVVDAAVQGDYAVLITADHGNLEQLLTEDGGPHVSHTANPVPFILIDPRSAGDVSLRDGKLADIAPTLLQILNIPKPAAMEGSSLAPQHAFGNGRRALLIILDGWGISSDPANDPIKIASTPIWDGLLQRYPHSKLSADGEAVGLKAGKAGNSEAGHMNIGAGRVVLQDDVRLDNAMTDGTFYQNKVILDALDDVKGRGSHLHLIGLLTEKSSHGSIDYPLAILKMAKERGLNDAYLHMIFDGRSTEPGSAPRLLEKLESLMDEIGIGRIVSGVGRGIALDRDGNYNKTKCAYDALVYGIGKRACL
jgi:2,3-bisphosphoglycerate-independent phosphoglycerate mutase